MISKKLFQVSKFLKAFTVPTQYAFTTYPNKKQQRILREKEFKFQAPDDLYFNHSQAYLNGGVQALCEHYKKNVDIDLAPVNAAYLMYNIAVADLYEPLIFEEIERHLHKYENKLRPRWAFGCLYGAYKTNAGSRMGLEFFQNELLKRVNELSVSEITQLIDAICYSTLLSNEEKINFIATNFLPLIQGSWKRYRSNKSLLFQLMRACYDLKYFEKEVWDPILDALRTSKQMSEYGLVTEVFETLHKVKDYGFYRDVSDDIAYWEEKIKKNEDLIYRYSVELKRYYTFQELKAKRDEIRYPDQQLRTSVEELSEEEKQKRRDEQAKIEEEKREVERDRNLNEIVTERYMQFMRGDTKEMFQGFDRADEAEDEEKLEEVDLDELERISGKDVGEMTEAERRRKLKEDLIKQKKQHKLLLKQMGAEREGRGKENDDDADDHERDED